MSTALQDLGWNEHWQSLFEPYAAKGLGPGRVIRADRGSAMVATTGGVVRAQAAISVVKAARGAEGLPVVGDWVAVMAEQAVDVPQIEAVLLRTGPGSGLSMTRQGRKVLHCGLNLHGPPTATRSP